MPFPAAQSLSVRLRLGLWYSLFLVVTIVLIGSFLLAGLQQAARRSMDHALGQRAAQLAAGLGSSPSPELDAQSVASVLREPPADEELSGADVYVLVLDRAGAVLGSSANFPQDISFPPDVIRRALAGDTAAADIVAGARRFRILARPVEAGGQVAGVVLVSESFGLFDETFRQATEYLVIAAIAVLVLSLLSSWWLTAHALRPILEVTRVAKRIAATGHVGERVAVPPARDELYELATTLNEMLEHLEQTVRRQRQFLADASHELRGPLMVIRGNLDLLQMDLPAEDRLASAREATEEVERMAHLVGNLLFLAEQDAHERMDSEPVPLNEVVDEVWQRACNLDGGTHALVLDCNEPATVLGDRYRLTQMLWNLVDNALRYTNPGGSINLCLRNHGQVAELTVADTGIGIPSEHVPHIFERFYRVDRARSRNESSTGLGLPIIKQVAEAHGGQVRVRSELGTGTTFTVTLPVAERT